MFHAFHEPLLKKTREAINCLARRDNASAFTLSEELSEELLNLNRIHAHAAFKRVMKEYGGLWKELDDAESKFDELLSLAPAFSKVVSEVNNTKDYSKLLSALDKVKRALSWFEENKASIMAACEGVMQDITDELKDVEEVKKLLNLVD